MTSKRFVAVFIIFFMLFLISVPTAIYYYQSQWHKLDFNVSSVTGEIKDNIAHFEINGTVSKRFTDSKKYDADNYLYGPCEGGEPEFDYIEVSSDSFEINNEKNNFTAYVDIDLLKAFGKDYFDGEQFKIVTTYIKQKLCLCAVDSNHKPYEYGTEKAVLYMNDYPDVDVEWK